MAMISVGGNYYFSKWNLGDTIGRLIVVAEPVHRQATDKKSEGGKSQWYYICRCSCGAFPVEKSQDSLVRAKVMCYECACAAKEQKNDCGWQPAGNLPEGVPNFATLPKPEGIETGPEVY